MTVCEVTQKFRNVIISQYCHSLAGGNLDVKSWNIQVDTRRSLSRT